MAGFDLIVLDFDGTFTDVEREAGPFFEAYRASVDALCGDVESDWNAAVAAIAEDPAHYGWTYDGHVVAPGDADPYLRATVIMNMVFDRRGLFPNVAERTDVLQNLYFENYPKAATVFREDAREVVETLLRANAPVCVVTNSATHDVQTKIDVLAPAGREGLEVYGGAQKYLVGDPDVAAESFSSLPETMSAEGLRRPIFVRRGKYFDVLRELWDRTGATPESTFVAGDIFELDLAMPALLGAHVHLVLKERTPEFEKAAVSALDHGSYSEALGDILGRIAAGR